MPFDTVLIAFSLTLFAGLATGLGSVLAFFTRHTGKKTLSLTLGLSAGVMIFVSFVELLCGGKDILIGKFGQIEGFWMAMVAFFAGVAFTALIDKLIPSLQNPHEIHAVEEISAIESRKECSLLYRVGIFTAVAIAIHNFPEGIATFTAALKDLRIGIPIAIAIAIHNIPEGIAVSVPIYQATGDRGKAFKYSFISGLAEPLGAIVGYLVLLPFLSDMVFGVLFSVVAGIMVFVSLDELLPAAEKYGEHHLAIWGVFGGMALMALSLFLLG